MPADPGDSSRRSPEHPGTPPRGTPDADPSRADESCEICGSTDTWWRNCKLICRNCGGISRSCGDL